MSPASPAPDGLLTPETVRTTLTTILPGLAARYETSLFARDDGSFTFCGVFVECGAFVQDRLGDLPPEPLGRLGAFVTECMVERDSELDTAAATCFLENLACEPAADALMPYLSGAAAEFLRGFPCG